MEQVMLDKFQRDFSLLGFAGSRKRSLTEAKQVKQVNHSKHSNNSNNSNNRNKNSNNSNNSNSSNSNNDNSNDNTPGLHNKIPALKMFARGRVAQKSFLS